MTTKYLAVGQNRELELAPTSVKTIARAGFNISINISIGAIKTDIYNRQPIVAVCSVWHHKAGD